MLTWVQHYWRDSHSLFFAGTTKLKLSWRAVANERIVEQITKTSVMKLAGTCISNLWKFLRCKWNSISLKVLFVSIDRKQQNFKSKTLLFSPSFFLSRTFLPIGTRFLMVDDESRCCRYQLWTTKLKIAFSYKLSVVGLSSLFSFSLAIFRCWPG